MPSAHTNHFGDRVSALVVKDRILMALGLDATDEVSNDEYWINTIFQGMQAMRLHTAFERRREGPIKIQNCYAPKPKGYLVLIKMVVATADGRDWVTPWFRPIRETLMDNSSPNRRTSGLSSRMSVSEESYGFAFSSDAEGLDLWLEYRGYAYDETGYPLVDTKFENALTAYARWRWIIRSRTAGMRTFSGGDEEQSRIAYERERELCRYQAVVDGMSDDAIGQMGAMLHDPRYRSLSPYSTAQSNVNMWDLTDGVPVSASR